MTKKDYVLIAKALNNVACNYCGDYPTIAPQKLLQEICLILSDEFSKENNRFNRDKFFDAVFKK